MHQLNYDDNNIFARILRGEIPCHTVYDDAVALAFMDVMPQSKGHFLVVPRKACRNLLDADPEILAQTIVIAQKLAQAAMKAFDADGVSLAQFNEAPAGQTVFHLHFHVIPRFEGVALKPHIGPMAQDDELAALAAMIRAQL